MRKTILLTLILGVFILSGCTQNTTTNLTTQKKTNTSTAYPMSSVETVADKLEIYYFHRTVRCYSCKTIGQYVREAMEDEYSEEIESGLIDFRELNVELPENKEIAQKYQASGSSLFINRIIGNIDNIEQDVNVWRLLKDEKQFKEYLINKINLYLGLQ